MPYPVDNTRIGSHQPVEAGREERMQVMWNSYQLSASAHTDNLITGHSCTPAPHQMQAMANSAANMGESRFTRTPVTQACPEDKHPEADVADQLARITVKPKIEELKFSPDLIRLIFGLTQYRDYIYFGSLVIFLHGGNVSPSDLDIICNFHARNRLVDELERQLESGKNKDQALRLAKFRFDAIPELNIPELHRLHIIPKNKNDKRNILLKLELCVMDPLLMPKKDDITMSSVAGGRNDFSIYSVTPGYQLNDMIVKNDNFCKLYLVDDYFSILPRYITRTVLFDSKNNEEADDQEVQCAVLMKALMHANKSISLTDKYIENDIKFLDKETVLETLKASTDHLLKAINNHPEFNQFKKEVEKRRSERSEAIKKFTGSLIALFDTETSSKSHVFP